MNLKQKIRNVFISSPKYGVNLMTSIEESTAQSKEHMEQVSTFLLVILILFLITAVQQPGKAHFKQLFVVNARVLFR